MKWFGILNGKSRLLLRQARLPAVLASTMSLSFVLLWVSWLAMLTVWPAWEWLSPGSYASYDLALGGKGGSLPLLFFLTCLVPPFFLMGRIQWVERQDHRARVQSVVPPSLSERKWRDALLISQSDRDWSMISLIAVGALMLGMLSLTPALSDLFDRWPLLRITLLLPALVFTAWVLRGHWRGRSARIQYEKLPLEARVNVFAITRTVNASITPAVMRAAVERHEHDLREAKKQERILQKKTPPAPNHQSRRPDRL